MAYVTLTVPDIALFSDPAGTRVEIPHLRVWTPTRRYDGTTVLFEGDAEPTSFRGRGRTKSHQVTCRYVYHEHAQMLALLALLDAAHDDAVGWLQLRTNRSDSEGMDPLVVAALASEVPEAPLGGKAWDITFTLQQVAYSLEV